MTYDAKERSQFGGAPKELYRFIRGATEYHYTSGDEEETYLGNLYTTETLVRTEPSQGEGPESGQLELTLPRTNPVAALFLPYLPEPAVGLVVYAKHRTDAEVLTVFQGTISTVSFEGATAKLTALPLTARLRRQLPRNAFQTQCNWALYSAQCGVVAASFRTSGVVTVISGDTIQATAFSGQANGWFNNGWVQRASGERRWIVNHVGSTLTLLSPFVGLAVNETVDAYAGCDRTESVCKTKFNNLANHLGFPRVPTRNPFLVGVN